MAQSLQELWQQANLSQHQGDLDKAENLHRQIVGLKPDALASWQFLSARAAVRGDFSASARAIRSYLKFDDLSAEGWRSLGVAEMQQGNWEQALKAFKEAMKLQPDQRANLVYLGGAAMRLGEKDCAADCLSTALQGMPVKDIMGSGGKAEPMMQAILEDAPAFLASYVASLVNEDIELEGNLKGARWRFHEMDEPDWNDEQQRPERFFLPAIPPQAWFEGGDLDWGVQIEAAYSDILSEVQNALTTDDATPYIADHMMEADHWKGLAGNQDWSAVHLYNGGIPNERVLKKFPKTMAALERLPLCRTGGRPVEVFFSLLKPGTHIVPHFGASNARLTVHLPIIVPEGEGCRLRAGRETKIMAPGKLLAFDDTFDHEAWNDGNALRVNLIFEAWNPILTVAEQDKLAEILDRYDQWFAGRGRRMNFLDTTFADAAQASKIAQQAEQAYRSGAVQARQQFEQALAINPKNKKALRYLADIAFAAGEDQQGLEYLRRFAVESPEHAATQYRLAVIEEQIGTPQRAKQAYARCLHADPRNILGYLYAGYFYERQGNEEQAAQLYSLGTDIDGRLPLLYRMKNVEPETALRSKAAFDCMARLMKGLHSWATDGVARVEEAIWVQHEENAVPYRAVTQRPHEFYIPGIQPIRFLDRASMPWAETVEAAFDDIKSELMAAMPRVETEGRPYLDAAMNMGAEFDPIKGSMNWTALDLFKGGHPNNELTKVFPKTIAALEAAPLVKIGNHPFEVFFSLLKPHQHIPPHFGLSNHGVTVHLPLIVPNDCRIRVDDEWRPWVEGELIAFDDAFDHEARNDSDHLRVVLIFEIWHPDLTDEEITAIRKSFQARADWMQDRRLPQVEDVKEEG